ncbi:MAG: hypothetical protein GY841_19150, partial [FCB group bacterium]|nr:hypothetical protein [FCB group bacterium]
MERIDRVTSRVARTIGKTLKIAILGVAAAAGTLGVAVNRLANDLDGLAKESRRLDFPIEELQKWQFVAGQSGLANEAFTKGLRTFSKRLGEAGMGFGALKESLGRSNPALLKQLQNTNNVADAFELYLKAIREAPRAVDKIALGTTAFGKAGVDMVNITHSSTKAIDALKKKQIENGIVTMRQAQMAEMYVDALDTLKRSMGGFMQTVLVPLLPIATVLMKRLREWVVANKEIIATRIKEWAVGLVTNFKRIVKWVKGVAIGIGIFFALAGALKAVIAVLTVVNALATANLISLIVLAVVAAIAAITALVYWAEELVAWFESIPAPIRIILMVLNPFIAMLYGFVKIVAYIKENWVDMWNGMVDTAEWAINALLQNGPISWLIAAQFTLMDL